MPNDFIFTRRSVRDFLDKPVEIEKLKSIVHAGLEAPSAHNRRPWEFMVITDKVEREAISDMSPYAKMLPKAAAAIVVCANLTLGEQKNPEDTYWIQDCSAATENILLQIEALGLGGVWLGWYPDTQRVTSFSKRFKLPSHIIPFALIAVGYPAKKAAVRDRYDEKLVHWEKW
ncbi:nitroreductase [Spirochaetia bacterium]|nr:nitroreductase [Spirochaetia bacterium]